MYIKKLEECDYCGELARAPIDKCFPSTWADGREVRPIKNKTIGTKCRTCNYSSFDDFCASQGCSAARPYLTID